MALKPKNLIEAIVKTRKGVHPSPESMIPLKKMKTPTSAKNPSKLDPPKAGRIPSLASNKSAKEQARQEIRIELVEKFKGFLQKGNYRVKAPEIAEKIVQKISEDKHSP